MHRISLTYSTRDAARLLAGLIALDIFFAAAHLFIFVGPGFPWKIVRILFDLDNEVALTTWFATVQLFAIGAVFLLAARTNRARDDSLRAVLFLAGLVFVFLSADEGGGIHERITLIMRDRGLDSLLFPGNHGGWIAVYTVAGSIFVLASGVYLQAPLMQIWRRFSRESLLILGGFGAIVLGGVGLEITTYLFLRSDSMADLYHLEVAIEECLEMAGGSVILYAALEMAAVRCSEEAPRTQGSYS